jgi:type IV pilus assembly protein PilC
VGIPTFFAFRLLLKTRAGRETWDQIKLLIPIIGGLVRKLAVGRFARTLAALYGAGVPIASALAMAGESSGNSVLEKACARMVPAVERGVSVAQAMGASGFFQPMVLGMVSTGETSGNMDVMLDKAADFYEEEGRHSITQLVVILGVLLLLLMALVIAIQVISFYGGFYAGGAQGAAGGAAGE